MKTSISKNSITKTKGNLAEYEACKYLQKQGLTLIEKNYHCRSGEIDLIMQDDEHIVFVEVRYRKNGSHGSALDSVNQTKINKIITTANHYLMQHQLDKPTRFDVIGFDASDEPKWVSNAFQAF